MKCQWKIKQDCIKVLLYKLFALSANTFLTPAQLTQKIKRVNPLGVPVAPFEIDSVTSHGFGLPQIDAVANNFVRLQNPQWIRGLRWRPPRFRARSAGTFPPQKFERIAADVAVIPLDLQRARV